MDIIDKNDMPCMAWNMQYIILDLLLQVAPENVSHETFLIISVNYNIKRGWECVRCV
jgi:hypothetical protein